MIVDVAVRFRDGLGPLHSAEDSYITTRFGMACEDLVQEAIASGWCSQRQIFDRPYALPGTRPHGSHRR